MITILGIESSCDDTAAALLTTNGEILANVVSGQDDIHARFGGVVPELASRNHIQSITTVVDLALHRAERTLVDIDLIGVTRGPGLIGSLLVGFSYAKALSFSLKRPFVGVDHMAGHLLSAFLTDAQPTFPYLALIVSGGTTALIRVDDFSTYTLLGRTRDDAAGEAFDKIARLLAIGYPGGPAISRLADGGDPSRFKLPRAWLASDSCDFSFSGLKTAVLNHFRHLQQPDDQTLADLCAAFQQAIVEVLVEKTISAARNHDLSTIVLGGGVTANRSLRENLQQRCLDEGLTLHLPPPHLCTDNAAMIAYAAWKYYENGTIGSATDDVYSRSPLGQ